MHELKIAHNIINIVQNELAERKLTQPVKVIHLKAGCLHAIIPESLLFNFDSIKKAEPQLRNARLCIEEIPLKVQCQACGNIEELSEPIFICPNCRNGDLEIISGNEMFIDNIELEE
ncbi:MAG TPA: hydrogenase maturation nickel metallochaperone HypA [Candidatus Marinimicrobia bacterium]|nr:hydrogenase maturation nickel metallochaperone HypA [Candidatus Neomarinimicrobiota bacterium]HRS51307.1 hydrogenase maturation nickel metallochaperone HypA [Candidatus Neomarinimicrobiota bacterium]HRU91455.1 hydrogenase maturation nickel metallochaperone HypA [Candidatus Neomarinimicrobiota bacterium]